MEQCVLTILSLLNTLVPTNTHLIREGDAYVVSVHVRVCVLHHSTLKAGEKGDWKDAEEREN
jgi:hypothetical protein